MPAKCRKCKRIPTPARVCLLISAHDEELILDSTLKSAIDAGLCKHDIFVVDDNSSDNTAAVAAGRIGSHNVLTVERSGKARALHRAIKSFRLEQRYTWVHFADADSIFGKNYFRIVHRDLRPEKYCAAIGMVQSMRGGWISSYRACLYSFGQLVMRRIESKLHVIPVMPGPTSIYRSDILKDLNFYARTVTEDFDMTLQIYRQKMGRIQYMPTAVNYTQDPKTIKGYHNQVSRWSQGYFQSLNNHRVGLHLQLIDFYIAYQVIKTLLFAAELLILLPLRVSIIGGGQILLVMIAADLLMTFTFALFGAVATGRPIVLLHFPAFFILRAVDVIVFVRAMASVSLKRLMKLEHHYAKGWAVADKRYSLTVEAMSDVAEG